MLVPRKSDWVFTCKWYFVAPLDAFHLKVIAVPGDRMVVGPYGVAGPQPATSPRTLADIKPVPAEAGRSEV